MRRGVPEDPGIPFLRLCHEAGLGSALGALGLPSAIHDVHVLKLHEGARCTLRVRTPATDLVVKAYAYDPQPLIKLFDLLRREGLAGVTPPTVPEVMAVDRALRTIVVRHMEGPDAEKVLRRGQGARTAELGGSFLTAVSRVRLDFGDVYDEGDLLVDAGQWAELVASADDRLEQVATSLLGRLRASRPGPRPRRLVQGSFRPRHILDADGPVVVDWDGFLRAPLELDAGYFFASLSRIGSKHPKIADEARLATEDFRRWIDGVVEEPACAWYRSAALLQMASQLSRGRPRRWQERARMLMDEAGGLLGSHERETPHR